MYFSEHSEGAETKMTRMQRIMLRIPGKYLEDLDVLVEKELYPSRSEAIRVSIRKLLSEELGESSK